MGREQNQDGILCKDSGEEMTDRRQIADELWEAFKHWEGERKYALRIIVKWLKNTPGSDAEGSCAPQADGSGEDS